MKKAAQDSSKALVPVKTEAPVIVQHDEGGGEEFIEIEEEPNTGVVEEWEKDIPPFLRKLSTMVNENRDSFIWKQDGSLIVKDPEHLSSYLLPTYFQNIKACSFVRQLNMYGFHKIDDPTGQNPKHYEFRHPSFVPGNRELLKKIERRKTSKRNTAKDQDEPRQKAGVAPAKPPSAQALAETNSAANQNSLLDAVTKLQQQTADNQQTLLQVLGELKSYRQSHSDLERKLNQYVTQPGHYRASSPPTLIPDQQYQQAPQHRPIMNVQNRPTRNMTPGNGNVQGNFPANYNMPQNGNSNMPPNMNNNYASPNGNYNNRPLNGSGNVQNFNNQAYPSDASGYRHASGMAVYSNAPFVDDNPLDYAVPPPYTGPPYGSQNNSGFSHSGEINNPNHNNFVQTQHSNNGYVQNHNNNYATPPRSNNSTPNYVNNAHHDDSPIVVNSPPLHSSDHISPYHTPSASDTASPHPTNDHTTPPTNISDLSPAASHTDPQFFSSLNFNEQIDEFVLLNLGLEDQGQFSEYLNSFSNTSNNGTPSPAPTPTAQQHDAATPSSTTTAH